MSGQTNVQYQTGIYGTNNNNSRGNSRIVCERCREVCRGEVVRVKNTHFHVNCFTCQVCGCDLVHSGFFHHSGEYICTEDYQRLHGTQCDSCDQYITGEVVSALGRTYHPHCFVCSICKSPFPIGDRVTFCGKKCVCQQCSHSFRSEKPVKVHGPSYCAGCDEEIKQGQSLLALERQWHVTCFKCRTCGRALTGEYISKDGIPYCETDYHTQFGIRCESCNRYISGRVLEAGGKHYHPSCARCSRCHTMFLEGEEMYLTGSEVWHPMCKEAARLERKLRLRRTSDTASISPPSSSPLFGSPRKLICSKADTDVLDYKQLAALPKLKALYDIQRPDIIPYQADHGHTRLSIDTLERYNCGQIQEPGIINMHAATNEMMRLFEWCLFCMTPSEDLLDTLDLRTRSSYSSAFTDSPAHSRHGGSPLQYLSAAEETNIYRKTSLYRGQDVHVSPTVGRSKINKNLLDNSSRLSSSNCNGVFHPESNYFPYSGSPKVSRVRRFSSGGEEDGWNCNNNRGIGRLILKEEMKARSGLHNDTWGSRQTSCCSSKDVLNNLAYTSLNGSAAGSIYSADSDSYVTKSASLPGYGRTGPNRTGSACTDYYQYDSSNAVNWQIKDLPV